MDFVCEGYYSGACWVHFVVFFPTFVPWIVGVRGRALSQSDYIGENLSPPVVVSYLDTKKKTSSGPLPGPPDPQLLQEEAGGRQGRPGSH
jgi:hypothetical protein